MRLRGTGANPWDEFGTTTGRPRRVGWLDGVLLRYAVRINGITELTVTKLDVLSGLENIQLCTAYRRDGKTISDLPFGPCGPEPVRAGLRAVTRLEGRCRHGAKVGANCRPPHRPTLSASRAWRESRSGWFRWDRNGSRWWKKSKT